MLRGAADEKIFKELFSSSSGINARANISTPGLQSSSSRTAGRAAAGLSVGENETQRSEERKHEAIATVRLVNNDGDVIWSTTQESFGGKFKGASADVADKVAKRLAADFTSARNEATPAPPRF